MTTKSKDEKNKLEKDKGEKADKNKAEKGKADKNKGEKKVRKLHYERELTKLQRELVKLQEWVRQKGLKVVVLFEGGMRRGRVAPSSALRSVSIRAFAGLWRWGRLLTRKRRSAIFSAMSRNCRLPGKSCSLIAVGTTARGWSVSWAFAPKTSIRSFCALARSLSVCWCAQELFSSSTGSRCPMRNRSAASGRASKTRLSAGS